jgi:hypothetical protein
MFRDNTQRAKNAIALFWVLFGITVISVVGTFMEYRLAQKALTGIITSDEANANDLRQRIIGIVSLGAQIIVIVYFIMWFRRAYANLHALRCYPRYSEGWAAGAWFVPFLNLVRPYEIMKDIWDRTQERAQEGAENPEIESSTIVGFWWFLWLGTNVAGNIYAWTFIGGEPTVRNLISHDSASFGIGASNLMNIHLVITIIKKISGFEEKLKNVIAIENIASEKPMTSVLAD